MNETSEEQNNLATHLGLKDILKAEDVEKEGEAYARRTLVSSKDVKWKKKLKILPEAMVDKDGAGENARVVIVVNSCRMQKEETYEFPLYQLARIVKSNYMD